MERKNDLTKSVVSIERVYDLTRNDLTKHVVSIWRGEMISLKVK